MKIIIYILFIHLSLLKLKAASDGKIHYTKIKDCEIFALKKNLVTQDFYKFYKEQFKNTKCAYSDIYIYSTDFSKVINCYLRTDLHTKVPIPEYVRNSILKISQDLNLKKPKDKRILNIEGDTVYLNTRISQKSKIKVGAYWKNLSFMSTSLDDKANKNLEKKDEFKLILKSPYFKGKEISRCSKFPQEKEFLIDIDQCWRITEFNKDKREIRFNLVNCLKDVNYGFL
jgi:hypothetical protein